MTLFAILILIQMIGLFFCALVLRSNLPETVRRVIRKNSKRSDGSVSRRRKMVEFASLDRSFIRVYVGLVIVFAMTTFAGLIVAGISIPLPNMDAVEGVNNEPLELSGSPFDNMRWPLVSVYLISSFLIAPILIANLYQSAVQHFYTQANLRFMDYYRQESLSHFPRREPFDKRPQPPQQPEVNDPMLPRSAPLKSTASKHR